MAAAASQTSSSRGLKGAGGGRASRFLPKQGGARLSKLVVRIAALANRCGKLQTVGLHAVPALVSFRPIEGCQEIILQFGQQVGEPDLPRASNRNSGRGYCDCDHPHAARPKKARPNRAMGQS